MCYSPIKLFYNDRWWAGLGPWNLPTSGLVHCQAALPRSFRRYTLVILAWALMRHPSHVFATMSHNSLLILLIRPDKFSQAVSVQIELWPTNSVLVHQPVLTPPDLPQITYITKIELGERPPSSSAAHMARTSRSLDGSLSQEAPGNIQSWK